METRTDAQASAAVELPARVIVWSGLLLRCMIRGRQVDIPPTYVQSGTTVHRSGDEGVVVVPSWYATALNFA